MFFPVYDPPENSTFTKRISYEILDLVENDILKYSHEGNIMIAGLILLKRDIIYKARIAQGEDAISLSIQTNISHYFLHTNLMLRLLAE